MFVLIRVNMTRNSFKEQGFSIFKVFLNTHTHTNQQQKNLRTAENRTFPSPVNAEDLQEAAAPFWL